ncbi:LysE family transporter [Clostridium sp. YIM B02515]|uniref:LysE family transporter n=1 Tax=Clostridium rhizosphaerae TaxID=2803861 RepID=A0ABS1TBX8_9CLOT|nr:LysE family transporter [Clostridium rhizosphaerae]MBL4936262.1 LysE family transporter [Clostridium rhizosphaerae]
MSISYILIIRSIYTGLFTGMVIAIPMGPAGFESVRWTMTKGLKKGVAVAAGSLIADAIDVMLINFGLLELIKTNKLLEVFFWEISAAVIFYIGYKALKNSKKDSAEEEKQEDDEKKNMDSRAVFTGFIVNFSNPMTHFFWLTLSSTVISIWRSYGKLVYFLFAVAMLCGMFLSLWGINILASKGKTISAPKVSGKAANLLIYVILAFGAGFFINGIYKLYLFLR